MVHSIFKSGLSVPEGSQSVLLFSCNQDISHPFIRVQDHVFIYFYLILLLEVRDRRKVVDYRKDG